MAEDARDQTSRIVEVADDLMTEFDGRVSPGTVSLEVLKARRHLHGQVPPDAMPEFLHRLARQRLEATASGW